MNNKLCQRNIKLFYFFNFCSDFRLYAPVAILYFSRLGGSFTVGTSVMAVSTLITALGEVPLGVFSDWIGRKKTLVGGAFCSFLSVLLWAFATDYILLFCGAVFAGISRALFSGNNDALLWGSLKQLQTEKDYSHYLGRTNSMFQWALGISAMLGGLSGMISLRFALQLSLIPQFAAFVLSFFFAEVQIEKQNERLGAFLARAFRQFRHNKKLKHLTLATVTNNALGEGGYQFQSAFLALVWPLWAIGLAKTLGNFGAAISFHFSGALIKKFREVPILIFSKIMSRVFYIAALLMKNTVSPVLMSMTSLFFGVSIVSENTLLQQQFSNEQRATMGSIVSLAGSLCFSVFYLAIGLAADFIGIIPAYLLVQVAMILTLFFLRELFDSRHKVL